eukprot:scaffold10729_cov91-Skeletonema_dohrnii-CCMP3373.AAC.7
MAAEGDNDVIMRYNYTGADDEVPRDATHVTVDESVRVIPAGSFCRNPSIVEVIFDENVKEVEECAFGKCPSLRRVIMPGVEVVEQCAFTECVVLTDVECGKLEIIKQCAFHTCTSLGSIDLPSAKIVEDGAFSETALTDVKFGSELERIEGVAFDDCRSLERITIPLKDGIIATDDIFYKCVNLVHVDLVEGEVHETIAALQLEEWRNDMNEEIDSINQILPTVSAGFSEEEDDVEEDDDVEGKTEAIRTWIRSVLGKIIHYRAEHQRLLDEEIATTLEHSLSQDIVMNNVLPFLELPSYTFEAEDYEEWEEEDYLDSEEEDREE